jgi:hypothetical protein
LKAFLARLTTFDWIKIVAYATAALSFLGGPSVLTAWGMDAQDAARWSQRIATIVGALTIISNTLKNPSPPKGTAPLLAQSATSIIVPAAVPTEKVIPI